MREKLPQALFQDGGLIERLIVKEHFKSSPQHFHICGTRSPVKELKHNARAFGRRRSLAGSGRFDTAPLDLRGCLIGQFAYEQARVKLSKYLARGPSTFGKWEKFNRSFSWDDV